MFICIHLFCISTFIYFYFCHFFSPPYSDTPKTLHHHMKMSCQTCGNVTANEKRFLQTSRSLVPSGRRIDRSSPTKQLNAPRRIYTLLLPWAVLCCAPNLPINHGDCIRLGLTDASQREQTSERRSPVTQSPGAPLKNTQNRARRRIWDGFRSHVSVGGRKGGGSWISARPLTQKVCIVGGGGG